MQHKNKKKGLWRETKINEMTFLISIKLKFFYYKKDIFVVDINVLCYELLEGITKLDKRKTPLII